MKLSHIFTNNIKPGHLFKIPNQPVNFMVDLTNSCNNRCLFCYNPDNQNFRNDYPDPVSLKKIVSLIGETGTKEILYLGGEPFIFREVKEILETGKKYEIFQRAVSNGSFFKNESFCMKLKESGLNEIGISFHSFNENIHDKIAGRKGAYQDALMGLKNCASAGIRTFVQYSPNKLNSEDDIVLLAQLIKKHLGSEVKYFDINRLLPIGQGRNAEHIFLDEDEWFSLLVKATSLQHYGFEVHSELTPLCWLQDKAKKYDISEEILNSIFNMNRGCFMWVAQLALDCKGRIKFCPAGPAVGPSILDVKWPDFWIEWKEFEKYRSFLRNNTCVDFNKNIACNFFYSCLGGCKYSRGTHYDINTYAIDIENSFKGGTHGEKHKDKQNNYSERFSWSR